MLPQWFLATDGTLRLGQSLKYHTPSPNVGGLELKFVFQGNYWTRVLAFTASMDPSLAVANRFVRWQIWDGNTMIYETGFDAAQTSNSPREYSLKTGSAIEFSNTTSDAVLSIPDMWLPPGSFIQTSTLNMDAGDKWVARGCNVEQVDRDLLRYYLGNRIFRRLHRIHSNTPPA